LVFADQSLILPSENCNHESQEFVVENNGMDRLLFYLRDKNTDTETFRWASDNISRALCAASLSKMPHEQKDIETPVAPAKVKAMVNDIMVISIYRAGQALIPAFVEAIPGVSVGSLLIQRNEETAEPCLFYKKLSPRKHRSVMILDPMLATAGTACMAVDVLIEEGYSVENIFFVGVIASEYGFNKLASKIPEENITVATVDPELNDKKYIVPGLGDYGDRYFGTI